MRHFGFAVLLFAMVPLPGLASNLTKENCRITTEIVSAAIKARVAGETPDAVKAELSDEESDIAGSYVATIGPLVDMVFSLDQNALTEQTAKDFNSQCLNY